MFVSQSHGDSSMAKQPLHSDRVRPALCSISVESLMEGAPGDGEFLGHELAYTLRRNNPGPVRYGPGRRSEGSGRGSGAGGGRSPRLSSWFSADAASAGASASRRAPEAVRLATSPPSGAPRTASGGRNSPPNGGVGIRRPPPRSTRTRGATCVAGPGPEAASGPPASETSAPGRAGARRGDRPSRRPP